MPHRQRDKFKFTLPYADQLLLQQVTAQKGLSHDGFAEIAVRKLLQDPAAFKPLPLSSQERRIGAGGTFSGVTLPYTMKFEIAKTGHEYGGDFVRTALHQLLHDQQALLAIPNAPVAARKARREIELPLPLRATLAAASVA